MRPAAFRSQPQRRPARTLAAGYPKLPKPPAYCPPAPRTPKLTRAQRSALPNWCFAIPETRDYPLTDKNKNWDPFHAKLALSHVLRAAGRHGPNPRIARRVLAKVHHIFPEVYRCESENVRKITLRHRLARSR